MAKVHRDSRTHRIDPKHLTRLRKDELRLIEDLWTLGISSGWIDPRNYLGKIDKDTGKLPVAEMREQREQREAFLSAVAAQVGALAHARPWFRRAVEAALKGEKAGRQRVSVLAELQMAADHHELTELLGAPGKADALLAQRHDVAAATLANKRAAKGISGRVVYTAAKGASRKRG